MLFAVVAEGANIVIGDFLTLVDEAADTAFPLGNTGLLRLGLDGVQIMVVGAGRQVIQHLGIHNLTNLIRMNQEDGIHIILSGVSPKLHKQLEKARFYNLIAPDHICPHIDIALEKAREFLAK